MEATPKVTVIIPVYNAENTIVRAVSSVINQTYENFNLLIINDGSTDRTLKELEGINNDKVRVVNHEINKGRSAARNTGINVADGEYVAFLDADDEWLSNKLEKQIAYLDKKDGELFKAVICGHDLVKDGHAVRKTNACEEEDIFIGLLKGTVTLGSGSTLLIKNDVLKEIGYYNEEYSRNEDVDVMLRYLKRYRLAIMPESLVRVYGHNSTIDADALLKAKRGFLANFRDIIDTLDSDTRKEIYARQWIEMAFFFMREANVTMTLFLLFKSLSNKLLFSEKHRYIPSGKYFSLLIRLSVRKIRKLLGSL